MMIRPEHVGLNIGGPLVAVPGHPQAAQRVLNIGAHDVSVELGIISPKFPGMSVSPFGVEPDPFELVRKGHKFLQSVRLSQMPGEVRGQCQPAVTHSVPIPSKK
jgi:hypothetical protein